MPRGIIVVSSHEQFGSLDRKTGYWLEEVTHFVAVMGEAGYEFDFVSPKGGNPPQDEKSGKEKDPKNAAFRENDELRKRLENSLKPGEIDPSKYSLIYFAGGHGAMWDFPGNEALAGLARDIYEAGGYVAAVCHGVAGLLDIRLSDGKHLIDGREVSGFTNMEETLLMLRGKVPYLLETELKKRGATIKKRLPFFSCTVTSGRLVTGQNPMSTHALAVDLVKLMRQNGHLSGDPEDVPV